METIQLSRDGFSCKGGCVHLKETSTKEAGSIKFYLLIWIIWLKSTVTLCAHSRRCCSVQQASTSYLPSIFSIWQNKIFKGLRRTLMHWGGAARQHRKSCTKEDSAPRAVPGQGSDICVLLGLTREGTKSSVKAASRIRTLPLLWTVTLPGQWEEKPQDLKESQLGSAACNFVLGTTNTTLPLLP